MLYVNQILCIWISQDSASRWYSCRGGTHLWILFSVKNSCDFDAAQKQLNIDPLICYMSVKIFYIWILFQSITHLCILFYRSLLDLSCLQADNVNCTDMSTSLQQRDLDFHKNMHASQSRFGCGWLVFMSRPHHIYASYFLQEGPAMLAN